MFEQKHIDSLFADLTRWGMTVVTSKDNYKDKIVLRRHYWDDDAPDWRFTIDRNTDTIHEFRLGKKNAKENLIKFLKNSNLWGEQ
jgi:hypothetical protein